MTQLLYQTDSYLREFEATVGKVDADLGVVALDRTAFYPGGGGQPCDQGTLRVDGRELNVKQIKRQGPTSGMW